MAVSFAQLNKEFNQILDKATHLAGFADVEGVIDQLEEVNILIGDTLREKKNMKTVSEVRFLLAILVPKKIEMH